MDDDIEKYFDLTNYRRVLQVASTPDQEEFLQVAKIAGVGVVTIGAIGFFVFQLMEGFPLIQGLLDVLGV